MPSRTCRINKYIQLWYMQDYIVQTQHARTRFLFIYVAPSERMMNEWTISIQQEQQSNRWRRPLNQQKAKPKKRTGSNTKYTQSSIYIHPSCWCILFNDLDGGLWHYESLTYVNTIDCPQMDVIFSYTYYTQLSNYKSAHINKLNVKSSNYIWFTIVCLYKMVYYKLSLTNKNTYYHLLNVFFG